MKKLLILLLLVPSLSVSQEYWNSKSIKDAIYQCKSDKQQFVLSGLTKAKYDTFCTCYINGFANGEKNKNKLLKKCL